MRAASDPLRTAPDEILRELALYHEAGIQHVMAEPLPGSADGWLRSTEAFARIMEEARSWT